MTSNARIAETPEHRAKRLAYHREWMRKYRAAHPEKAREANARFAAKHKDLIREHSRKRYAERREEIIAKVCEYAKRNRDKINKSRRARDAQNPERAKAMRRASYLRSREKQKAKRATQKDKLAAYMRHKRHSDPSFCVADRLRRRINCAISRQGASKTGRLVEVSGCSVAELVRHIETQFLPGMSWGNRQMWHIDHIIPCSAFDLTDPGQQRVAFHYTNLRPVWAVDNHRKHAKIPGGQLHLFWTQDHTEKWSRKLRQTR